MAGRDSAQPKSRSPLQLLLSISRRDAVRGAAAACVASIGIVEGAVEGRAICAVKRGRIPAGRETTERRLLGCGLREGIPDAVFPSGDSDLPRAGPAPCPHV